jgi:hypothetical protein
MSEPSTSEHWLDRLAVRVTRRTVLKAGLTAAAAITVPSLRPSGARADINTYPCFEGCRTFEHQEFGRARSRCDVATNFDFGAGYQLGVFFNALAATSFFVPAALENRLYHRCLDTAITNAKVAAFDCYAPGCSGFDPKQPNGPCDTCSQNCCVCPGIPNGYICCFYACGDPDHNCCGS